jgi:hypothetical protein
MVKKMGVELLSLFIVYLLFFFFLADCDLKISGPHACYGGTLPLESLPQPSFFIFKVYLMGEGKKKPPLDRTDLGTHS